jgi:uncharacterized membrane protein YgdD (TMEM256/DUF423 family)
MILVMGSILGFISVAFGAYAEHGLKAKISEEAFRQIMTAIRYNQVHAVVIICLGLFLASNLEHKIFSQINLSGWLFIAGTIIFSFSIYLARGFDLDVLVNLAPLGGITLMLAWLSLAYAGIKSI